MELLPEAAMNAELCVLTWKENRTMMEETSENNISKYLFLLTVLRSKWFQVNRNT